jgi:hypothetical protein
MWLAISVAHGRLSNADLHGGCLGDGDGGEDAYFVLAQRHLPQPPTTRDELLHMGARGLFQKSGLQAGEAILASQLDDEKRLHAMLMQLDAL